MTTELSEKKTAPVATSGASAPSPGSRRRWMSYLSFRRISAIYILVIEIVVFSILLPETFLRPQTFFNIAGEQSITVIVALGLLVPLSAGVFDLAVGLEVGLGAILVAFLISRAGLSASVAILTALAAGVLVGLLNGLLVVKARIDSFIATLGTTSVLTALVTWISGATMILGLDPAFQELGNIKFLGLILPFYLMIVIALVISYFMEFAPIGRRFFATGGNLEAARLSGVNTSAVIIVSFIVCAVAAAIAGVLVTAQIGSGDPTLGPSYLLPAFTAVFLGSTQFRNGRFNVLGTIVAVYVLAVGVKGLQLAGAPNWIPYLFNGVALLLAVGLAKWQSPAGNPADVWKMLSGRRFFAGPTRRAASK